MPVIICSHSIKRDCISLTLQGEKSLIAADTTLALPTRSDARGRTDEKFAPFALSRISSSATYSCLWCLRWIPLDNTLNCYPYLKRPILHIKAVPKVIRERLSNKSILQHFLYCGSHMETKGLNLRHRYVSSILGKMSIYKHPLFSAVPLFTIPKGFCEAQTETALMGTKDDLEHSKIC